MANKNVFKSAKKSTPVATAINLAGGAAYSHDSKHSLAQLACTGTINDTFYATAEAQVKELLTLASQVDSEFLAKVAIYSRNKGYMKDMPAVLLAILAARQETTLLSKVFPKVVNNGRMLRNFVQIIRSGVTGRKSFGSAVKRIINSWMLSRNPNDLFKDSVGNDPSLVDVIRLTHPTPKTKEQEALLGYILGKTPVSRVTKANAKTQVTASKLPELVTAWETFKENPSEAEIPDVPTEMIASFNLTTDQWRAKARQMSWTALRMNINTLARNGCFSGKGGDKFIEEVAAKLVDAEAIKRAKIFPYQLYQSFRNMTSDIPTRITNALQDAMEIAVSNIPELEGGVTIAIDVSGSMSSNLMNSAGRNRATGNSNHINCRDVAALTAVALLRSSKDSKVMVFDTSARWSKINPRDSVMTNTNALSTPGGGTDVSCSLRKMNEDGVKSKTVIIISDNESWYTKSSYRGTSTATQAEWQKYQKRVPGAKLVCMDLVPNTTTQVNQDTNVLNVGGFSDTVFTVISEFSKSKSKDHWIKHIEDSVSFE